MRYFQWELVNKVFVKKDDKNENLAMLLRIHANVSLVVSVRSILSLLLPKWSFHVGFNGVPSNVGLTCVKT